MLAIIRSLTRHRWLTVPIVVLMAGAVLYILVFTPSRYEATSSYVLFTPPPAPTADDIKDHPELALVHAENPYARMDPSVVVGIVAKRVNADAVRKQLIAQGADERYEVTTGGLYGIAGPTADILGVGDDPGTAITTAKIVGAEFASELRAMQRAEGTDDDYMVKASAVEQPDSAQQKVSSRLRSIFGVLALGAVLLFAAVSIGEALDKMRSERNVVSSSFFLPSPLVTVTPQPWARRLRIGRLVEAVDAALRDPFASQDPNPPSSNGTNGAARPGGASGSGIS